MLENVAGKRCFWVVVVVVGLAGCGGVAEGEGALVGQTPSPTVTPAPFVPTVTPLPPPTELPPVVVPTDPPPSTATPTPTSDPNVITLLMTPNLGDVGQAVAVSASGFLTDSEVSLYWTMPGVRPGGRPVNVVDVDDAGTFAITLFIPDAWPDGNNPAEHEFLELRAIDEQGREAWATYGYTAPVAVVATGSTYFSVQYGYAIDLPVGWVAEDSDPAFVQFGPEGQPGGSWVQVFGNADVDAVIDSVMAQVAPGQTFQRAAGTLPVGAGVVVMVDGSQQAYWFVSRGGRTYGLYFVADGAATAEFVYSTFRITN